MESSGLAHFLNKTTVPYTGTQRDMLNAQYPTNRKPLHKVLTEQSKMLLDQWDINKIALDRGNSPDYDINKWIQSNPSPDNIARINRNPEQAHFSDIGKRPSHITFSTESAYSKGDIHGGNWVRNKDNTWTFYVSPDNLSQHTKEEYLDYFSKYEKGNKVVFPDSSN